MVDNEDRPNPAARPPADHAVILPGATLGVLGGGQLGRMFAQAAQRLGYRAHVFCQDPGAPAAQVCRDITVAALDDGPALEAFADAVEVCTLEFENIPAAAAARVAARVPLRPGPEVLRTVQHRLREKHFLAAHDLPVTPFADIRSLDDLRAGVEQLGAPCVLKTAASGYDGKGQIKISLDTDPAAAWDAVGGAPCVLEAWVAFEAECSIVAARGPAGDIRAFPLFHNEHANHILDVTTCPAPFGDHVSAEATALAERVLRAFDYEGLICVEFFLRATGELVINEIAPRPHNSGHLTIEAARTSQFEQQVRAVCGLPLGDTGLPRPAAMANLLGDRWRPVPAWEAALREADCSLHLYGKPEARPGRKMGHLTCLADDATAARAAVTACRDRLG